MNDSVKSLPVVLLMGPTASGKTDVAIELVKRFPMEIISVDSAMIYRGMDIGTAKPSERELSAAPHRLIDILDPAEPYSAARFREDALREIADIQANGRVPLLTGGTMMYFKVFEEGIAPMPTADPAIRQRLEAEAAEKGWAALHDRLRQLDPVSARRIHPNDPQRLQRALEVYELSGETLTALYEKADASCLPFELVKMAIIPDDRQWLHRRIEMRFDRMLEQGFVEEVRRFHGRDDLHCELPSMRSVGYRQCWAYLDGEYDFDTMRQKGMAATRQLAKRQFTWLRSRKGTQSISSGEAATETVVQCIERVFDSR